MTEHELKTWPEYIRAIETGRKKFELRKNDRRFAVGDILHLRGWNPDTKQYTGIELSVEVTYILGDSESCGGLNKGYVVMSIQIIGR